MGILGRGMPPCFPVSDLISDQQNLIFHTSFQTRPLKSMPVFRPGLLAEIMLSLPRLERKQKILQIHFEFAYFSFLLTHLELKR